MNVLTRSHAPSLESQSIRLTWLDPKIMHQMVPIERPSSSLCLPNFPAKKVLSVVAGVTSKGKRKHYGFQAFGFCYFIHVFLFREIKVRNLLNCQLLNESVWVVPELHHLDKRIKLLSVSYRFVLRFSVIPIG